MSDAIVRFARVRPKPAWYELDEPKQTELFEKVQTSATDAGASMLVLCDARFASEEWFVFLVEEFPSLAAVEEHTKRVEALGWYRYVHSETMLGRHRSQ